MKIIIKSEIQKIKDAIKKHTKLGDTRTVIRLKVILAYKTSKPKVKIATYFDISVKSVSRWIHRYKKGSIEALVDNSRSGRPPKLNKKCLDQIKELIKADQERVWSARHVYCLIVSMFSLFYAVKYIPELLKKMGLSFHKAVHYLIKKNEEKRAIWIKEKLPEIYAEHVKNGWRIFYQDEVGFQTEGTLAYSWGPVGVPIVVNNKGRHGRVNLMGLYEVGSGEFFYKMTFFRVNALRFKRFLCCLKRKYKTDKFIIIADNASFHKAKWFTAWWKATDWLKLEFLPAYSPDFNPIERLWKWIKKEYTHNKCWSSKVDLRKYLEKKLIIMTADRSQYLGTMNKELLRLNAAFEHHDIPFPWADCIPKAA
jgi:transposase